MSPDEKAFLIGLSKLTRETGVKIGGCGCCGSPFLGEAKDTSEQSGYVYEPEAGFDDVRWVDMFDSDWDRHKDRIVR